MKKCVLCGRLLDDNNPAEHIINNALGGVLKDNGIYCEFCNSKYGTGLDVEFTKIFYPIMARLNMHKDRKSAGSSYFGVVCDEDGKLHRAEYQGNRIKKFRDADNYANPKDMNCTPLFYEFNLNNDAFKLGLAKTAFNYAVHQGLDPSQLERVFDNENKELVSHPVVIPFIPLTLFDAIMERKPPEKLFHALRVFNYGQMLYVYVELFSAFQYYILMSERYNYQELGDIDCSDGNLIEQKEMPDEEFLKELTPKGYKDAILIAQQYGINLDELVEVEQDQAENRFHRIGKLAYEIVRKQSYLVSYEYLVDRQYDRAEVCYDVLESELFHSLNVFGCTLADTGKPLDRAMRFFNDLRFYTVFEDDRVDMRHYKQLLPDGTSYPWRIYEILSQGQDIRTYGYMKVYNLLNNRT